MNNKKSIVHNTKGSRPTPLGVSFWTLTLAQHHQKVSLDLKQATAGPGAVTTKATKDMNGSLNQKEGEEEDI